MRTDAEKRSLVENGLSWDTDDTKPSRRSLGSAIYETGSLKSGSANKWKKTRPQGDGLDGGKGELKKPQTLGQGNMLKKGRNPPVGVTSPITHTAQSGLKVAGNILMGMSIHRYIKYNNIQCNPVGEKYSKNETIQVTVLFIKRKKAKKNTN